MFYCDPCAGHYNYPPSMMRSFGACEICGRHRECNDRKSTTLPVPPEGVRLVPWRIEWVERPWIEQNGDDLYTVVARITPVPPALEIRVDRATLPSHPGVNWSGMGRVKPEQAWAYSEMMQLAARLATVGDEKLAELLKEHPRPNSPDDPRRELNRQEKKIEQQREHPGTAWVRQTKALREGDPCEWRYPAYPEWHPGTVVQNGGSGYWEVRDEREGKGGEIVKGLYVEMIKAKGGAHYEDKETS